MDKIQSDTNSLNWAASFIKNRSRQAEETFRINGLVRRYKDDMPAITAHWDVSEDSVRFNEIPEGVEDDRITVFECGMEGFWAGLFDPSVYEADTLWTTGHWDNKIAKVIEAWEKRQKLSPVFLIRYGDEGDLAFVSDGKHRLTVARAIRAASVPFMVGMNDVAWAEETFPSARKLSS
jgi:hypothetical protein